MSRNFDSFIKAFTDYSESTGAAYKFRFWSAVSAISAALERKTWVVTSGNTLMYPNQYILLIGGSGSRKSTIADKITEIIYSVDGISHSANQLTGAALIQSLQEAGMAKTFNFHGKQYKNSSLFAFSNEAATMFKNKEDLQELFTDFYDCGKPNVWSERPSFKKKTLSNGDVRLFNPCLNFLGCSTREWLVDIIGERSIKGGFIPRFLMVESKEVATAKGWNDIEEQIEKLDSVRDKLIDDLKAINEINGRYKTAVGWSKVYNEIEKEIIANINLNDDRQPFYNRKLAHCLKIAQVLAADRSNELVLLPEDLQKAYQIISELEEDMYNTFNNKVENKSYSAMTAMWFVLRKKDRWTRAEILKACLRFGKAQEINEFIATLVTLGKIKLDVGDGKFSTYVVVDRTPLD